MEEYYLSFPLPGLTPISFMDEIDPRTQFIETEIANFCGMPAQFSEVDIGTAPLGSGFEGDEERIWREKKTLDVIDLLKGKGRGVLVTNTQLMFSIEVLRGKFVIIARFTVPIISGSPEASACHSLIALSQAHEFDCRFVLVIKVKPGRPNKAMDFQHFFSGFPDNFLAIPFDDAPSRDFVFNSISLVSGSEISEGLVVDPDSNILAASLDDLQRYGAASYPFSKDHIFALSKQDQVLKDRIDTFSDYGHLPDVSLKIWELPMLSLAELVQCVDPEGTALARIHGPDCLKPAPLSALDGKLVGLYICADGDIMGPLKMLQERCSNLDPQFEVVVVPLALRDHPITCLHHVLLALQQLNISSWWTFYPYNDNVMRTLWRISGNLHMDRLILLPYTQTISGGTIFGSGEIEADAVLSCLGLPFNVRIKSGGRYPDIIYPFTRERLFYQTLYNVRSASLVELLEKFEHVVPCKGGPYIPVKDLLGKKVLLFLNCHDSHAFQMCCSDLLKIYSQVKMVHRNCEVVCVFSRLDPKDTYVSKLPWLRILLPEETASVENFKSQVKIFESRVESLRKALFLEPDSAYVVTFSRSGDICSRKVLFSNQSLNFLFNESQVDGEILQELNEDVESVSLTCIL